MSHRNTARTWVELLAIGDISGSPVDADGDDHTGGEDILAWQAQFGIGVASTGSTPAPEPGGAVLLLSAAGLTLLLGPWGQTSRQSAEVHPV